MITLTSAPNHALPVMDYSTAMIGAVTAIAGMVWLFRREPGLPPGPPVYVPGLGHLLKLAGNPFQEFRNLREKYGDIFTLYMGNQLAVVINGYEAINEVLYNRGQEFSHRCPSFVADKMAENKGILNTSGRKWSEQRIVAMKALSSLTTAGGHLDLYLESEVERLCEKLKLEIQNGGTKNLDLSMLIKKAICSISFAMAYGRVLDYESSEITIYTESMDELFGNFGSMAVVNFIPFVSKLPGDPVSYHRCIQLVDYVESQVVKPEIQRLVQCLGKDPIDNNGNIQRQDSVNECFAAFYLKEMYEKQRKGLDTELSEEQLIKAVGDFMGGSFDPSSITLLWLALCLTHHQDVQERCREEIRQALGVSGGYVTGIKESELVYTQATIMEVQRWCNVVPFPPAHSCNKDTTVRGYHIPKDTTILFSMDSLMMCPEVGDRPSEFLPDRFIAEDGTLKRPSWFMPFTIGPRACVGANMARKELLAFTLGLLSKFKFQAPVIDGQRRLPSFEGDFGLTHTPKPFKVCLEQIV